MQKLERFNQIGIIELELRVTWNSYVNGGGNESKNGSLAIALKEGA